MDLKWGGVLMGKSTVTCPAPPGRPETLRPRRGRVRCGGHRSVVADPEQGRAVLDEAPGVGGVPPGPGIRLRTSDSPL
jgi:hypothetical protein